MSRIANGVQVARLNKGAVRVAAPEGTSLDDIFKPKVADAIRRLGRGGCAACISGLDLLLEQFEEVVQVDLAR